MSDDQNNPNAMRDSKDTSQPEASFAPCPGWDAAVDAVDSYDHEIKILEEAQRIIKQNELPQFTWQTWDVWAGRTVHHLEDTQGWMRRVLQRARENVRHPNDQAHARRRRKENLTMRKITKRTAGRSRRRVQRVVRPKAVWIVFDPKGEPRSVFLQEPSETVICWPYASDLRSRNGEWVETPKDLIAANKKGYRLKRCALA